MTRKPHADLKREIANLAEETIATDGPAALAARPLAAAGGCSVGTLYNLFGHLDGVVREVNRRTLARLRAALDASLAAAGPSTEARLTALADAYLDFALANPGRWEALFRHRLDTPPEEEPEDAARLFALLRKAAGPAPTDDALRALWAAVHGVVELALSRRLLAEGDAAERRYLRIIVAAGLAALAED